jgi:hypothetical protein
VLSLRPLSRSSLFRAVSRWCALTIVALAVTPFTSPFSTFDPGMFARGNAVHRNTPVNGPTRGPSIADAALSLAAVGDETEYLKNLALAPAAQPPLASNLHGSRTLLRNASSGHLLFGLLSSAILRI